MGHLPPPGDMRLGTSSPALPQPHMTPPPPPPDGDTDTTGCSAPQAAPVRAAGPAASSSSGPTACNRPSSSGPLEQFLVNHFAKPLARLLNLKHHQDLRTLAIVSVFYYLQWFRWHHWDTAVAERVRGWGSGPAGVGLPMAVSESLILLLDLLWLAMGCLWAFFCATIVHNCIHVAQFHNYHVGGGLLGGVLDDRFLTTMISCPQSLNVVGVSRGWEWRYSCGQAAECSLRSPAEKLARLLCGVPTHRVPAWWVLGKTSRAGPQAGSDVTSSSPSAQAACGRVARS